MKDCTKHGMVDTNGCPECMADHLNERIAEYRDENASLRKQLEDAEARGWNKALDKAIGYVSNDKTQDYLEALKKPIQERKEPV